MALFVFPLKSINGSNSYNNDDFRQYFANFISTGILASAPIAGSTAFQVLQTATPSMNVNVGAGVAWIAGGQVMNTSPLSFQIPAPLTTQARTDSIVIQWSSTANDGNIFYKKNSTQVVQTADVYELQIATITVPANASSISQANIKDMRADPNVCGYSSPFESIKTGNLLAQFEAELTKNKSLFETWFKNLQDELDSNQAANLQNQINALAADDKVVHLDGDETITGKKTFTDKAAFTDITVSKIESLDDTDIATINATNAPSAKVHYMRQNGTVHVTAAGNWGTFEKGKGLAKATLPAGFRPPVEWGAGIGPMGGNSGLSASIGTDGVLTISSSEAGTEYGTFSMSYPAAN